MSDIRDLWFLVVRDRYEGTTHLVQFADDEEAWAAYLQAEERYRDLAWGADPKIEVVLIGADSEDGLRASYSHYFSEGTREQRQQRLVERLLGHDVRATEG